MNETSNIVALRQPDETDDPLTDILRSGARQLLAQAVEIEAETFLAAMKDLKLYDGRDRVVRHGHGPTRKIQTGVGPVEIARVKSRDRGAIRVRVGRRRFPAGSDGRPQRVHAGADRRDAGRQEGTHRLPGRRAGKRAELARTARRGEKPWAHDRPGTRRR